MRHPIAVVIALALAGPALGETPEEKQKAIRAALETKTVDLEYSESGLAEVLEQLEKETGMDFVPTPAVAKGMHEGKYVVDLNLKAVMLGTGLRLMLGNLGLAYRVREGRIWVETEEEAREVVTRTWDVRGLMVAIRDFPGPSLELTNDSEFWGVI